MSLDSMGIDDKGLPSASAQNAGAPVGFTSWTPYQSSVPIIKTLIGVVICNEPLTLYEHGCLLDSMGIDNKGSPISQNVGVTRALHQNPGVSPFPKPCSCRSMDSEKWFIVKKCIVRYICRGLTIRHSVLSTENKWTWFHYLLVSPFMVLFTEHGWLSFGVSVTTLLIKTKAVSSLKFKVFSMLCRRNIHKK